ncbi:6-phosphogluconolactonase [Marinilabilia sp.]|uniref:6-phosphogluconolactonase n=1 Tax=Marinilabilia sp. TaxID=2021252 RepID=UPI0025BAD0C6|nr:6-phosphogluconolactonase [Marinilabilia sp.]
METKIFYSKEQLARFFGDYLSSLTQENDQINIALSGGSTPETIFDVLSQEYRETIKWDRIRFFWGDERCVPPGDPESNFNMTHQHLFSLLSVPEKNIFRVKGELPSQEALEDYREVIAKELPSKEGLPLFDVVLLGMGDDGHTASVFPHEIDLWDSSELCEIGTHPTSGQKRITLTGKVINNAREIVFLVTGKNKAEKVDEILNEKEDYQKYPAARVNRDKSLWLLDQEAVIS